MMPSEYVPGTAVAEEPSVAPSFQQGTKEEQARMGRRGLKFDFSSQWARQLGLLVHEPTTGIVDVSVEDCKLRVSKTISIDFAGCDGIHGDR